MGDNSSSMRDGLSAVKDYIAEANVYYGGEKSSVDSESFVYNCFETQISNCGDHLLESRPVSDGTIMNAEDCYFEIIYRAPQTLHFKNTNYFSIQDADRILYNADTNMLYWGEVRFFTKIYFNSAAACRISGCAIMAETTANPSVPAAINFAAFSLFIPPITTIGTGAACRIF